MATTAAPAPATSSQPNGPGGRAQIKVGPNNSNPNRRGGIQSPVDGGASKRNGPHKAWNQQGHSAGQQKYQTPNPAGGQKKSAESDTPDKHMNDRTMYMLGSLMGKRVTTTLKNGSRFEGVLAGVSPDLGCVLKFCKQIRGPQGEEDQIQTGYVGGGFEKSLVLESKDLMDIYAEATVLESSELVTSQNGTSQFRTDVDISGNQPTRERELQRWSGGDEETFGGGGGLEEPLDSHDPNKKWDQFETNERRFGVKSDFDENIYTTKIDTNHPLYKKREAEAARIAREIETTTGPGGAITAHQAEERGLKVVDDSGQDEEDKYSSVQRAVPSTTTSSGTQKYMPPALRAQVSAPPTTTASSVTKDVPRELVRESTDIPKESTGATSSDLSPTAPPAAKQETSKKALTQTSPAVPVIPTITEQAPSPRPPSVSSFKPEDSKPKDKAPLPESVKKASVAAVPAVPVLPIHKGVDQSQQSNNTNAPQGTLDKPLKEVRDAFKQFHVTERERLEKKRQAIVKKDKDVKLQDLMKFAKNFKLKTPVPQDLVPILAKDKAKQDEILEKSRQNAAIAIATHQQNKTSASQQATGTAAAIPAGSLRTPIPPGPPNQATNASQPPGPAAQHGDKGSLNKASVQRFAPQQPASFRNDRPAPLPSNMNLPAVSGGRGIPLSARIEANQRMKQSGGQYPAMPVPTIDTSGPPPTGPAAMQPKPFSPTRYNKLNAQANDFRPNPNAATFTPVFTAPQSQSASSTPAPPSNSRATSPSVFFGSKKPKAVEDRAIIGDSFDPFKRAKVEAELNKDKPPSTPAAAGGKSGHKTGVIEKPWSTLPTWQVKDDNKDKKYAEVFERSESATPGAPPHGPSHQNSHPPQHPTHAAGHPIPTHITQGPHIPPERHHHHHPHHMPGPPSHFGDPEHHNRHLSSPPNVLPSPSMQPASMSFGSPAQPHAMLYPNPQGQMPPQYNQFGGYRPGYGGPQFMQPPGGANAGSMVMGGQGQQLPFMVPGPFQGMHQGMYSPHQMHAFNGQQSGPPPPPSGGYPSPGRGAPMMMHQNSQQGHQTPVPPPMMLSMSSGPTGHPPQPMMRPFPAPPHFGQHPGGQHHPQNQYGQYPGGRPNHPHHNSMPGHPSGPSPNISHDNNDESK